MTSMKTNPVCFEKELEQLINKHSKENASNTPDFILASYLYDCLKAFNFALQKRESWYGRGDECKISDEQPPTSNVV